MNQRDKVIADSLTQFRVLNLDHIAQLHFSGVKHPITKANAVLKRIRRDGHVTVSTERRMYVYLTNPPTLRNTVRSYNITSPCVTSTWSAGS